MGRDSAGARTVKRLVSFFLVALALGLAPGPDILFVFSQSLAQGSMAGMFVTLGLCTGLCVHVTLAALGVAKVLETWPRAFQMVTWCGAAYLVWLGVGAWRSAAVVAVDGGGTVLSAGRLYLRGIVMNVCNPKVILFFVALLPRFIVQEKGHVTRQFLTLGLVFALATWLVFSGVAMCGGGLARLLSREPSATAVLQRFSAFVLFGLAAWIAWMNLRVSPPKK